MVDTGSPLTMTFVISDVVNPTDQKPEVSRQERIGQAVEQNPIIRAIVEDFGGEVVW